MSAMRTSKAIGTRRRHYRQDDRRYRPRRLGRNDTIYRGSDNRYYCKRDDGTSGLIIGGVGGGVLGNIIAPGGIKVLGTIIGAARRRDHRPADRQGRRRLPADGRRRHTGGGGSTTWGRPAAARHASIRAS